ncbi:general stress protein [Bacillus sp. FJAT-42376]|uniref:general stress protein n=1 Tax=Bacillus sp. FJAT-42376 TaxID=2014076 RepID=UPI000F514995|nr:general stress protein [Bacillus sp. FJAT-42376]AZB40965.1 general stress protein [Bacillus sp. FJAT-42376]
MKLFVVENGVQASEKVKELEEQGLSKHSIFLFAQDPDRSRHLTENTDTKEMSTMDKGLFNTMANAFRSRTEELTSKMAALGLSQNEALHYEEELASGRIVILAKEE